MKALIVAAVLVIAGCQSPLPDCAHLELTTDFAGVPTGWSCMDDDIEISDDLMKKRPSS